MTEIENGPYPPPGYYRLFLSDGRVIERTMLTRWAWEGTFSGGAYVDRFQKIGTAEDRIEKNAAEDWVQVRAPDLFPLGCTVTKPKGPQWRGVVVGYYSSTFTPEGLVIECTADGAKGQVHVEPAKRMIRDDRD